MAKTVHIQIHGAEKPLAIRDDEIKETQPGGVGEPKILTLSIGGTPIGEFKGSAVDGWWIEE